MTRREAMLAALDGETQAKLPVSLRIELWYADAALKGALPLEVKGLSQEEVEDYLGFCRAARHRARVELKFRGAKVKKGSRGDELVEEYLFGSKALVRRTRQASGVIGPHIVKYPLETEDDYDLMLSEMEDACLDFDIAGFDELDSRTGDAGLPVLILHACPAHLIMLRWTGYQNFYLQLNDFPEKVERLISCLEDIFRRELWPAACRSPARLVLHGNHFSTQMTPLPIFERYFLPYFEAFNSLMHQQGKKVMWHADAEMGGLLGRIPQAGFDAADCLATFPLVPERIEDYFAAWKEKIVCWGGLPSVVFDPTFAAGEYRSDVNPLKKVTEGRSDFIFGASDQVMPGAQWERLLYLAEVAETLT